MSDQHEKSAEIIKSCCTKFYENDLVSLVLGENFHPGGEELTLYLGEKLRLDENSLVLDVACGSGTSAITLAKRFGCHVVGIDLSEKNLAKARVKANAAGLSQQLNFVKSDAENITFDDETFDVVMSECALCTFPDMKAAVNEMHRVLKKGGKIGITDVTIEDEIPNNLKEVIYHVICIAGALSAPGYQKILSERGFTDVHFEDHSYAIREIIERVGKLAISLDIIEKFCECDLAESLGINLERANNILKRGFEELEKGTFKYGLFTGIKEEN